MLLSSAVVALVLSLATCASAAKRMYLVSSSKMRPSKVKSYCHSKGGWAAVIDKENLKEAIIKMNTSGVDEVYVGKRLGRKLRSPKIVLGKDGRSGRLVKSSGKRELRALCQTSESYYRRKSRKGKSRRSAASTESEESSDAKSSSSEEERHKSRRPRGYKFKGASGRTYEVSNRH